jgi:hypothetical protein
MRVPCWKNELIAMRNTEPVERVATPESTADRERVAAEERVG